MQQTDRTAIKIEIDIAPDSYQETLKTNAFYHS